MFQRNAALASSSAQTARVDSIAHLSQPAHADFPNVARARRAFEGLLIKRGRDQQPASIPYGPRPTAAPGGTATSLKLGVAESVEQIEATSRLVRTRYAWRGYRLDAFDHELHGSRRGESRHELTFFVADPPRTLGTITLRLDGPEGLRAD
ncbi:MAG TPA: hypothetical protein VMU96_07315, partial [Casimicrobiaceae bacterium]|nr:hypothetical protein [Casimicrobiaceae bacterium]